MEYSIEIRGEEPRELFVQLYQKALGILPVVTTALYALAALLVWMREDEPVVKVVTTVLYVIFAVVFLQIPKWTGKRAYKAKLKYYGGTMPEDICRFGEEIVLMDVDSTQKISYGKIRKIYFFRDGIGLRLTDRRVLGIPNREFTRGSLAELKQLFREKRPDLKIPE